MLLDTFWLPVLLWAGKGPSCPAYGRCKGFLGSNSLTPFPAPPSTTHHHSHQSLEVPWSMADTGHEELPEAQTICREARCH